jgi:hypothetical protein
MTSEAGVRLPSLVKVHSGLGFLTSAYHGSLSILQSMFTLTGVFKSYLELLQEGE